MAPLSLSALRQSVREAYHKDETVVVDQLKEAFHQNSALQEKIQQKAELLIQQARDKLKKAPVADSILYRYHLSSPEGLALMCLAEAFLRIPDTETANELIKDKLSDISWGEDTSTQDSFLLSLSESALKLAGKILSLETKTESIGGFLKSFVKKSSEPVIHQAVRQAIGLLSQKFVIGETLSNALQKAPQDEAKGYTHSYDMLGEAALTREDADAYFKSYRSAIEAIGKASQGRGLRRGPGVSVKLSALHPRYEYPHKRRVLPFLIDRLMELAQLACSYNIGLTIDAEESHRLELSMDIFEALLSQKEIATWGGLGFVVQAYQKRAVSLIAWLEALGQTYHARIPVRLVKGAYWDTEIKVAQEQGVSDYPVFTRKSSTDLSYLVCAQALLSSETFYPQFATHNAHTIAAISHMAGSREFEFQKLYGMGNELYSFVVDPSAETPRCRIYAPVGTYKELLPYLTRRLIENGANASFVNHIADERLSVSSLAGHPYEKVSQRQDHRHPDIPLPKDIYGEKRLNSTGMNLSDPIQLQNLEDYLDEKPKKLKLSYLTPSGERVSSFNPFDKTEVGTYEKATPEHVAQAYNTSQKAFFDWTTTPVEKRGQILETAAHLLEKNKDSLIALCAQEAGKTLLDGIAEVREAVDFCRYYAQQAQDNFARPVLLPGVTGEQNSLSFHGRGTFVCVSPWNFPLAIFMGQVSAALVTGNTVLAKPAGFTPLIAARAVQILHEAGVPKDVLHLLPGNGETIGQALIEHPACAGVALTGSLQTAWRINQTLAHKQGSIVPFIAETGGQNAMIVDSSALLEQVVLDSIASSFRSAGQRCSALRVVFIQEDCMPRLLKLLSGAMEELMLGDPLDPMTDVGPVISQTAMDELNAHKHQIGKEGKLLYECTLPTECETGYFVAPAAFIIHSLDQLKKENFGPILHIIPYQRNHLEKVIKAITIFGYGLTQGIHTRIHSKVAFLNNRLRVGNMYVNRNMIGAIVGAQPFGGEGLSGTGPKAGGAQYLYRFVTERTLSVNTTAQGGNTALLSLEEF